MTKFGFENELSKSWEIYAEVVADFRSALGTSEVFLLCQDVVNEKVVVNWIYFDTSDQDIKAVKKGIHSLNKTIPEVESFKRDYSINHIEIEGKRGRVQLSDKGVPHISVDRRKGPYPKNARLHIPTTIALEDYHKSEDKTWLQKDHGYLKLTTSAFQYVKTENGTEWVIDND